MKVVTVTNRNVGRFVDGVKILASVKVFFFFFNILYTKITVLEKIHVILQ